MRSLAVAVISADAELRRAVRESNAAERTAEIPVAATDVGVEELQELESLQPDVVIVQLDDSPELGLRLVEFLAQSARDRSVLVAGPAASAELLLEVMRAGATEYLPSPVAPETVRAALQRLGRRFGNPAAAESQSHGRVCTFVGVKGGVGTTTLAANVAVELRRRSDQDVLLADFRLGLGDAAVHLGLAPRFHLADVIENLHRMDAGLLASFVESDHTGVQLLSSPGEAESVDSVEPEQIRDLLRYLRSQYAYTIVDAPNPYSSHARAVFAESDQIVLVVTPEVPALRNAERVLSLLGRGEGTRPRDVRLVVNRFVASRSLPVEEIQRLIGLEVRRTIANDPEAVTRSINEGKPIIHSKSAVARELGRLAGDLLRHPKEATPQRTGGAAHLIRAIAGWARGSSRGSAREVETSADEEPREP